MICITAPAQKKQLGHDMKLWIYTLYLYRVMMHVFEEKVDEPGAYDTRGS